MTSYLPYPRKVMLRASQLEIMRFKISLFISKSIESSGANLNAVYLLNLSLFPQYEVTRSTAVPAEKDTGPLKASPHLSLPSPFETFH